MYRKRVFKRGGRRVEEDSLSLISSILSIYDIFFILICVSDLPLPHLICLLFMTPSLATPIKTLFLCFFSSLF